MNKIGLKIAANSFLKCPYVTADSQPVKLRRNGQWYEGEVSSDAETVFISVQKHYELESKLWFLIGIGYFFISLFGLFDCRWGGKFRCLNFTVQIKPIQDTHLEIKFLNFVQNGRAAQIVGNCAIEEISNVYYCNKLLRRRRRILALVETLIWFALIAAVVCLVLHRFGII